MKKKLLYTFVWLLFIAVCFAACGDKDAAQGEPNSHNPEEEAPYVFPEDGVLSLLENGLAPAAPNGNNPSFVDDRLLVYFDFAFRKAGLSLSEDTEINYEIVREDGTHLDGKAKLDTSVSEIQNEYGYIGVCFDVNTVFEKFERIALSFSFCDAGGKEYSIQKRAVCKDLSYYGIDLTAYKDYFGNTVDTKIQTDTIRQVATVDGKRYALTIELDEWAGKTTPEQIFTASCLFWQCYPRMHARFGEAGESPLAITLAIEDKDYEIAYASGNFVHLHDGWLQKNPNDFDCLTHEFAHVIQNGWEGDYCEYSGYIERFADACRYLYAFDNGKYNDIGWELQTVDRENTRETSVRFLVWLDYFYSEEDNDLLLNFFTVCRNGKYTADNWDQAWQEILKGSKVAGGDMDQLFRMYQASEFAKLSSKAIKGSSPLLDQYDVRKDR